MSNYTTYCHNTEKLSEAKHITFHSEHSTKQSFAIYILRGIIIHKQTSHVYV